MSRITRRSMIIQSAAGAIALAGCKHMPTGASGMAGNGNKKLGLIYFAPEEGADNCMKGIWDGLKEQGFEKDKNLTVLTAHANAEARNLGRLAARAMASPRDLSEAVDSIRRTFDLDAVAVLRDTGSGWTIETAVGATQLQHPDQADYQVQIGAGRVLAIIDARRAARDTAPLEAFLTELRLARGRALLQTLASRIK